MELGEARRSSSPTSMKLIAARFGAGGHRRHRWARSSRRSRPRTGTQIVAGHARRLHHRQGTEEMEWEGAARMYLQHYLSETGFIPSIEGQRLQDQRKPHRDGRQDHRLRLRRPGVRQQDHLPEPSVKAVAGMLSAIGAQEHPGTRPEVQGPVAVGAAVIGIRSRGVPATRGRRPGPVRSVLPDVETTEQRVEPATARRDCGKAAGPRGHVGVPDLRRPAGDRQDHEPHAPDPARGRTATARSRSWCTSFSRGGAAELAGRDLPDLPRIAWARCTPIAGTRSAGRRSRRPTSDEWNRDNPYLAITPAKKQGKLDGEESGRGRLRTRRRAAMRSSSS